MADRRQKDLKHPRGGGRGRGRRDGGGPGNTEQSSNVDESSPTMKMFRHCQIELDEKHDRHERIVKLSRDITVESKRAIFLMHRIVGHSDRDTVLEEAKCRLEELDTSKWCQVALELHAQDPYQYRKAYTNGLQEYIEAVSFYHFLKQEELVNIQDLQQRLQFEQPEVEPVDGDNVKLVVPKSTGDDGVDSESANTLPSDPSPPAAVTYPVSVHVPPVDYMLGIADLTGELMRMAINSVGSGDLTTPFKLCQFLRTVHDAFLSFGNISRELPRKLSTLRASMQKVEAACYTLQIRGSEIPKHMLVDMLQSVGSEAQGGDYSGHGENRSHLD